MDVPRSRSNGLTDRQGMKLTSILYKDQTIVYDQAFYNPLPFHNGIMVVTVYICCSFFIYCVLLFIQHIVLQSSGK